MRLTQCAEPIIIDLSDQGEIDMTKAQALKIAEETLAYALKTYGKSAVAYAARDEANENDMTYDNMCLWQNQVWLAAKDVAYFKAD